MNIEPRIPIGKATKTQDGTDEPEVQGHRRLFDPNDQAGQPGQAVPETSDEPEVQGHRRLFDPDDRADEQPLTSNYDPDIEGHIR